MKLPIRNASRLWHWGHLDQSKRKANLVSLEGKLFSMSVFPNAWRDICKYHETPLYCSGSPIILLDSNAIFHSRSHYARKIADSIINWGVRNGLIEETFIYLIRYFDELDQERQDFYRDINGVDLNKYSKLQSVERMMLTICSPELNNRNGYPPEAVVDSSYILIEWAKQYPHIGGIYWNDCLRKGVMAPRCGLYEIPELSRFDVYRLESDEILKSSLSDIQWACIKDMSKQKIILTSQDFQYSPQ